MTAHLSKHYFWLASILVLGSWNIADAAESGGQAAGGCILASPPQPMMHDSNSASGVTLVPLRNNRYLSFRAGDAGQQQAIRVTFVSLPSPFHIWNGQRLWVGGVREVCEVSGSSGSPPCPGGGPSFRLAELECFPVYADWSGCGQMHATHPGVVPLGVYDVQVIDDTCTVSNEADYSTALSVTNPKYGDLVGAFDPAGNYFTTADNSVGVATDVTAALNKFGNRVGSPIKPRVKLEPCRASLTVSIADVNDALLGFRNLPYRFAPGSGNCTSTDPCAYAGSGSAGCGAATAVCGNGIIESPEACDNGLSNSDTLPDACRTNCTAARCGDLVIDTGEQCDPPNGGNCSNTCQNQVANPGAPISLVPVLASGIHTVSGNEIRLETGGQVVTLELRVGDWDPNDTGVRLQSYQATIDATGYGSGCEAIILPFSSPCTIDGDCTAASGDATAVCDTDSSTCNATLLDNFRPDRAITVPAATGTDEATPFLRLGAVVLSTAQDDPVPFPAAGRYGGTFRLSVPVGASGNFTVGFVRTLGDTSLVDQGSNPIPITAFQPAYITVGPSDAACCLAGDRCVNPIGAIGVPCPGGQGDCPPASTCTSCTEAVRTDCEGVGGYWLGEGNIAPGEDRVVDCSSGRCNIGSCCDGGSCFDRATPPIPCDPDNPSTCMNQSVCESVEGTFVGGALCTNLRHPCDETVPCCVNGTCGLVLDSTCDTTGTRMCACGQGACTAYACDPLVAQAPLAEDGGFGVCGDDDDCPGVSVCLHAVCTGGAANGASCDGQTAQQDCVNGGGVCGGGVCYVPKNRYLSFRPNNPTEAVAFRVDLVSSTTFPGCMFTHKWVGAPDPLLGVSQVVDTPIYRIWTEPVVQVADREIVPATTYEIRAIPAACDTGDPGNYSTALALLTGIWGDVGGPSATQGAPDGIVDFANDRARLVESFDGTSARPLSWFDLAPEIPDRLVGGREFQASYEARQGQGYPGTSPCAAVATGAGSGTPPETTTSPALSCRLVVGGTELPTLSTGDFWPVYRLTPPTSGAGPALYDLEFLLQSVTAGVSNYQTYVQVTDDPVQLDASTACQPDWRSIGEPASIGPTCDQPPPDPDVRVEVLHMTGGQFDYVHFAAPARESRATCDLRIATSTGDPAQIVPNPPQPPKYLATYTLTVPHAAGGNVYRFDTPEVTELLQEGTYILSGNSFSPRLPFSGGEPCAELRVAFDCNENSIPDDCEIDCNAGGLNCNITGCGTATDCNTNGIPDECEIDSASPAPLPSGVDDWYCDADCIGCPQVCCCDDAGTDCPVGCDCVTGANCGGACTPRLVVVCAADCDNNGNPDDCDIAGPGNDCQPNCVLDACEPDCDFDGLPDDCEPDCDLDTIPDDCESEVADQDCNGDGTCNDDEIAGCLPGTPECDDCNANSIPDGCDIADATSVDCHAALPGTQPGDGVPDECDINPADPDGDGFVSGDCPWSGPVGNGVPDECDIVACAGELECRDCQPNGVPDGCDIATGTSCDSAVHVGSAMPDGIPDECRMDCARERELLGLDCRDYLFPVAGTDAVMLDAVIEIQRLDGGVELIGGLSGPASLVRRAPHYHGDSFDILANGEPCVTPAGFVGEKSLGREVHFEVGRLDLTNVTDGALMAGSTYADVVGTAADAYYEDSLGEAQATCADFPADTYVALFARIQVGVGEVYYNKTPILFRSEIPDFDWTFPSGRSRLLYDHGVPAIPLVDDDGVQRAYLVRAVLGIGSLPGSSEDCGVEPGITGPVSFAINEDTTGYVVDLGTNNVYDDRQNNAKDVRVYVSSSESAALPPDNTNRRDPNLQGTTDTGQFLSSDALRSLSFGRDGTLSGGPEAATPAVYFSVAFGADGRACSDADDGTDVALEGLHDDVAGDVFVTPLIGSFGAYPGTPLSWPCDPARAPCLVLDQTALGLGPPADGSEATLDDLAALELSVFGSGGRAYMTFTGSSFSGTPAERVSTTIFRHNDGGTFTPAGFAVYARMGQGGLGVLRNFDIMDALAVSDVTPGVGATPDGVWNTGDELLFSLAPGSPTLTSLPGFCTPSACSAADLFYYPFGGPLRRRMKAEDLGLLPSDDIDAIDVGASSVIKDCFPSGCRQNGVTDACDIARGYSLDSSPMDGIPDECATQIASRPRAEDGRSCTTDTQCGSFAKCVDTDNDQALTPDSCYLPKNRYLSFQGGDLGGRSQAIRVTFIDLPNEFSVWNGRSMFVDDPVQNCEIGGWPSNNPPEPCASPAPRPMLAALNCDPIYRTDWSSLGLIHVYNEGIVPGGRYRIEVIDERCEPDDPSAKSQPLFLNTNKWGDVCGRPPGCVVPDALIEVTVDVNQVLQKFRNAPAAPVKVRADLEPGRLDAKINISDVTQTLNAFRSIPYPFRPPAPTPCN